MAYNTKGSINLQRRNKTVLKMYKDNRQPFPRVHTRKQHLPNAPSVGQIGAKSKDDHHIIIFK